MTDPERDPLGAPNEHPLFARNRLLPSPWNEHFPTSVDEAHSWVPCIRWRALSSRVLVVARTRIEGTWAAYVDAVPGLRHEDEIGPVLDYGAKLDEPIAIALFPKLKGVPYAH